MSKMNQAAKYSLRDLRMVTSSGWELSIRSEAYHFGRSDDGTPRTYDRVFVGAEHPDNSYEYRHHFDFALAEVTEDSYDPDGEFHPACVVMRPHLISLAEAALLIARIVEMTDHDWTPVENPHWHRGGARYGSFEWADEADAMDRNHDRMVDDYHNEFPALRYV